MATVQRQTIFLRAEWANLIMLNYAVDAALLESFVPPGTQLDEFNGKTYVSLVGFEFNRSRVLGVRIPFHQSFEEVNLRFYVKRSSRRGVVFVRELVPKYAVATIARIAFGENYSRVAMSRHAETLVGDDLRVEYRWGRREQCCSMQIETEGAAFLPPDGSDSQFITEHYWGYAVQPDGSCLEYEVQHPRWRVRRAKRAVLSGSLAPFYGVDFAKTLSRTPDSAFLAEGSDVAIMKGSRII